KGKNPHELIHAILTAPLPRPSVVGHDIPDELDDVLLQALRKNPAERYRDADDFAHVLESTKHHLSPGAWQSASRRFFTPFVRYQKRETRSSLVPVVLVIIVLLVVAYLLWG
ncbi:MAG: hypothetical protein AB1428_15080, partial [Bacteroidota bacterium]